MAAPDFAAANVVSARYQIARWRQGGEQGISGESRLLKQAGLGSFMRLCRTVGKDVPQAHAPLMDVPGYQQEAMAIERFALGAHERDAMARGPIQQAIESGPERWRRGHQVVVRTSLPQQCRIVGPAAQLRAEKDIADAGVGQPSLDLRAAEVRPTPGMGDGAHVGDCRDAGSLQQCDEALARMIRMADGEDDRSILCNALHLNC